jgi:hypothetical protein
MLSSTNHLTLKAPVCPATLTLAQLGAGSVTPVLDKLLRVADTYGVSSYKVDAAIVFTLSLLNYLGMKNEECFHVVERYRASCSGLSGDQRAALDQLADALEQRDDTQLDALSVRDRIDTKRAYYLERARKSVTERLKVIVRTEDDVTDAVMAFDGNSITLTVTAAWARLGQNGKDTIASRIWNTTASYSQGMGWTDKYSTTTNLPQLIFVDTDGKQLGSCSY